METCRAHLSEEEMSRLAEMQEAGLKVASLSGSEFAVRWAEVLSAAKAVGERDSEFVRVLVELAVPHGMDFAQFRERVLR